MSDITCLTTLSSLFLPTKATLQMMMLLYLVKRIRRSLHHTTPLHINRIHSSDPINDTHQLHINNSGFFITYTVGLRQFILVDGDTWSA